MYSYYICTYIKRNLTRIFFFILQNLYTVQKFTERDVSYISVSRKIETRSLTPYSRYIKKGKKNCCYSLKSSRVFSIISRQIHFSGGKAVRCVIQFRRDRNRHILHARRRPPFTINFAVPCARYRGQQYPCALTELPRPTGVPGRIRPYCEESGIRRDARSRTPRVDRCAVVTSSHSCQEAAWHRGVASLCRIPLWYLVRVSCEQRRARGLHLQMYYSTSIDIALAPGYAKLFAANCRYSH